MGGTQRLWERIVEDDSLVTIGLKSPGAARGVVNGEWLLTQAAFEAALEDIRAAPGIVVRNVDRHLPAAKLKIASRAALSAIARLPFVDYVEPTTLLPAETLYGNDHTSIQPQTALTIESSSGPNFGYYTDAEGNRIPHIYDGLLIPLAWQYSTGAGVTVGLIDTGVDTRNPDLSHWTRYRVYAPDGEYDEDTHGTHQAGSIGARRNGWHIVGASYDATPISIKHSDTDPANKIYTWRVAAALDTAVSRGADVVNMSLMSHDDSNLVSDRLSLYYSGYRSDGTRYDVLFVGAAGSGGGVGDYLYNVVFPARHSAVIAVSAIDYDTNQLHSMSHSGAAVELSSYHGMPSTGTQAEGFAAGATSNSSNASALVSGIAALVRSRYPTKNNTWVRSRLRYGARDFGASGRDYVYGYGIVNAYAAVGGFYSVKLQGNVWHGDCFATADRTCYLVYEASSCFTETLWVTPTGEGPFQYQWSTGSTSNSANVQLCPDASEPYPYTVEVTVTKPAEGKSIKLINRIAVNASLPNDPY